MRWLLSVVVAIVGTLAVSVGPAEAAAPLPLPALAAAVRNACTGQPVSGANVSLTSVQPQSPPIQPARGLFLWNVLPAGDYALQVTAPGYLPIGNPSSSRTDPGVPFGIPSPPPILPAGTFVAAHAAMVIRLIPGDPCTPSPPPILPALAGAIRDSASGLLIPNATVVLSPLDGQQPGGPPIRLSGLFAFPTLAAGRWDLAISAPGYTSAGVTVAAPSPPPILPAGASVAITQAFEIQLARR